MEIALAVLLVLSFPITAIAGLVIAIGARDRVRVLEQCFARFQARPPGLRFPFPILGPQHPPAVPSPPV